MRRLRTGRRPAANHPAGQYPARPRPRRRGNRAHGRSHHPPVSPRRRIARPHARARRTEARRVQSRSARQRRQIHNRACPSRSSTRIFPEQNVVIGQSLAELKPSPGETETVNEFRNAVSEVRHWSEPLALPVRGCMTSPFGVQRYMNGKPTGNFHGGLDQRSPAGTPVHAVDGGIVKIVRKWNLHGGTVGIDHGQGLESIYLHMSKLAVAEGAVGQKRRRRRLRRLHRPLDRPPPSLVPVCQRSPCKSPRLDSNRPLRPRQKSQIPPLIIPVFSALPPRSLRLCVEAVATPNGNPFRPHGV